MESFIATVERIMKADSFPALVPLIRCPACSSPGNCTVAHEYERWLIDYCDGEIISKKVKISVVCCRSCGRWHAYFPDFILPHYQHSLRFILAVVDAYLKRRQDGRHDTAETIAERFGISSRTVYRWVRQFGKDKLEWLGVMEDKKESAVQFLNHLKDSDHLSEDLHSFFLLTARSFLQARTNHYRTISAETRRHRPGWNKCSVPARA